jgi:peptide deformylase
MLINSTDPLLHQPVKLVTDEQFADYKNLLEPIASLLIKTIYEKDALGVSACQLGIDMSMFASIINNNVKICVNPEIVAASFKMSTMQEGCLSYPGLLLKVKRPAGVMVRYKTIDGQEITERLEDLEARVWLHEFDHCQGICFTDRVSKLSMDMAKRRLAKTNKRNKK